MYTSLNNFSPVIISCLVYMLYDDKLYMLKSINKVSVLFLFIVLSTLKGLQNSIRSESNYSLEDR